MFMRKPVFVLILLCFAALPAFSQNQTAEELLTELRSNMQGSKAAILAKNLTLTAEQAAKFWPMFEAYQKEQNVILDEQLKGIKQYVDQYETLTDATAVSLLNAHFDRDTKMTALRKKWLAQFQKVLPTKLAVRAMQIDRRLSLAQQFDMSTHIPLAR